MNGRGRRIGPRRCDWRNRHGRGIVIQPVGDEHAGLRVFLSAELREMNLPKVLQTGRGMHARHGVGVAAFARAVVDDGDARAQAVHHHLRIGAFYAVVQPQEQLHRRQPRVRAHQLEFHVARQIAQMRGAELPEGDVARDRHRIFGVVVDANVVRTFGIGFARTG